MQIWTKIIAEGVQCAEGVTVNVGAQQQQQVCTTLSATFFFLFYTVSHYIYLCLKKFKRRGTRRQLPSLA